MAERHRPDPRHTRGINNLPQGLLDQLSASIRGEDGIAHLIVFGSYARGEAGPNSDLDLCVIFRGDETDTIDAVSRADCRLYQPLHASGLEYDLVAFPEALYHRARPRGYRPLLDRIEREGVEVCSNN